MMQYRAIHCAPLDHRSSSDQSIQDVNQNTTSWLVSNLRVNLDRYSSKKDMCTWVMEHYKLPLVRNMYKYNLSQTTTKLIGNIF